MQVYVDKGKIIKIAGLPIHRSNKGRLCVKGLSAIEYEYDSQRLTKPLMRVGKRGEGCWKEIPWKEALDIVASGAKLLDGEAIGATSSGLCTRSVHQMLPPPIIYVILQEQSVTNTLTETNYYPTMRMQS